MAAPKVYNITSEQWVDLPETPARCVLTCCVLADLVMSRGLQVDVKEESTLDTDCKAEIVSLVGISAWTNQLAATCAFW